MTKQNPESTDTAAHAAFLFVEELIDLLVEKNVLTNSDRGLLFSLVIKRLSQNGSEAKQRAATFLTGRKFGDK
jgi:hypothetical protein